MQSSENCYFGFLEVSGAGQTPFVVVYLRKKPSVPL